MNKKAFFIGAGLIAGVAFAAGPTVGLYAISSWFASNVAQATTANAAVYGLALRPTEYDNGNSGTSKAIDWSNGIRQKVTLTGNCTFTVTGAPTNTSVLQLKVIQDTTGSRTIAVTGAKWANAVVPVPTSSTGAVDIVTFYYDGTSYYGNMTKNYQ